MPKFTDAEYFAEEMRRGIHNGNPSHMKVHAQLAKWIAKNLKPANLLEIGCGTGAFLECCLNENLNAWGYDTSIFHKSYWDNRNPKVKERFIYGTDNIPITSMYDCVVSIEVFEHLTAEQCHDYLRDLEGHCKWFIFSSTSDKDTPEFDEQWGHINVQPQMAWDRCFAEYGFDIDERLTFPTPWTKVYKNVKI